MSLVFLSLAYLALGCGIFWGLFYPYSLESVWRARRGYLFIGFLVASVCCLMISYSIACPEEDLDGWGKFVKCSSEFLQFFSLDLGYKDIAKAASCYPIPIFFSLLMAVETVLAPVAGACFIGQLLCSFIPRWRLFISPKRTKFVFSELNERSIALAEDIARLSMLCKRHGFGKRALLEKENIDPDEEKWLKSACILFTDAYASKESEADSELLMRAKRIGAICLKDDIKERPLYFLNRIRRFSWQGGRLVRCGHKVVYFLIDRKEENNLTTAISLLREKRYLWKKTLWEWGDSEKKTRKERRALKKSDGCKKPLRSVISKFVRTDNMDLYVFTQDSRAGELLHKAMRQSVGRVDLRDSVLVKCVNESCNIVYKMFDEKNFSNLLMQRSGGEPLDSDLSRVWNDYFKRRQRQGIRIVIFGGGQIAKEYLKTAAWCCKMSAGLKAESLSVEPITISVFAKNVALFQGELLAETGEMLDEDCTCQFFEGEFPSEEFLKKFRADFLSENAPPVQRYLVAFGDDRLNHEAARWIRDRLVERFGVGSGAPPAIIDFAIESNEYYDALREEYVSKNPKAADKKYMMRPFNTMRECFLYSSVRMDELERRGMEADRVHNEKQKLFEKGEAQKFLNSWQEYNRRSSVAAAVHTVYKWFCRAYDKEGNLKSLYELMFSAADKAEIEKCENLVGWLEHRRWIAYMRSCGYRCPTAKEFVAMISPEEGDSDHKDPSLRLHACMLESGAGYPDLKKLKEKFISSHGGTPKNAEEKIKDAIRSMKDAPQDSPLADWLNEIILKDDSDVDALDRLSLFMTLFKGKERDFKKYDINISKELYRHCLRCEIAKRYKENNGKDPNGDIKEVVKKLAETWPGGAIGEIQVFKEEKYRLILAAKGSELYDLKTAERLEWEDEFVLIKIPNEQFEREKQKRY